MKPDLQAGLRKAKSDGLLIVSAKPCELQIDLDSPRALRRYGLLYAILRESGLTKGWKEKITPSRKRGHVHITIQMPNHIWSELNSEKPEVSLCLRIGMQAILGSDLVREAHNFCRAVNGSEYPVVFFESIKREKRRCR